jgi:hypothetical protein
MPTQQSARFCRKYKKVRTKVCNPQYQIWYVFTQGAPSRVNTRVSITDRKNSR